MKRVLFTALVIVSVVTTALLFGQGIVTSGWHPKQYDPKASPPLDLPKAYALAANYIGSDTNQFWCVTATCLETNFGSLTHWAFGFSNTNGERTNVMVFFDNTVVHRKGATLVR